jgi:hypothetical protein
VIKCGSCKNFLPLLNKCIPPASPGVLSKKRPDTPSCPAYEASGVDPALVSTFQPKELLDILVYRLLELFLERYRGAVTRCRQRIYWRHYESLLNFLYSPRTDQSITRRDRRAIDEFVRECAEKDEIVIDLLERLGEVDQILPHPDESVPEESL